MREAPIMDKTRVKNLNFEILSDNWYTLNKVTFDYLNTKNEWENQSREAYDRGNGATILLYNREKSTVILTEQFRMPTYINGNQTGMLIEACAGLLDEESPETCIKRETEEETGFEITNVQRIFEVYMSPGSVTEIVFFFIAEYNNSMKVSEGGGATEEQEDIKVIELNFNKALEMVENGKIKDAKTIMLLYHIKVKSIL